MTEISMVQGKRIGNKQLTEVAEVKVPSRRRVLATGMLDVCKKDAYYRWRHRGTKMRSLAATFGRSIDEIEDAIREMLDGETTPPSRTRRAAVA